ncbi:MAG TPA: pitrilysin family protein, partial [Vulgatibacter sp.]
MQVRLPNGLNVILQENRAAPVVALQAWVQVGSADETDREAGLAHLHEHMLFKGTRKRGPGVVARDIESRGGEVNAWTSFDQTVYHLTIASRFFEDGLEILGDQVLGSIFDPEELAREIEVVIEEIKRSEDSPSRRASRALFDLSFQAHTYGRPVIGFPETVRSFSRDDVLAFYRRHYTPDNITLVVVGDFEEAQALRRIESIWSGAAGRHAGHHPRTTEPEPTGMRARAMREQVKETHLALAWPIPDILSEELVALDLAAAVLGHGDSARLVQEVKRDRQLCNEIYAYAYTPKDPGLFVVGAMLPHERTPAAVDEILRQVYRLREEGPTDRELSVAKHLVESEAIWQKETVQGVARKLGFYSTVTGSLDFERRYYERIREVSAEEIRA